MAASTSAVQETHPPATTSDGTRRPLGPQPTLDIQLGRGFAWAAAGRIGAYAAAILSGPIVARMLTPDSLGDYFLATTVAMMASMLALMGLSGVAIREVSAAVGIGRHDRARAAIVATVLLACISGAATAGLLVSPVGRLLAVNLLHSPRLHQLMPLVAAWTVLLMAGILANSIWRGLGSVRLAIILSDFAPKTVFAAGVVALWLVARHVGVEAILWLWLGVSGALVALWTVLLVPRVWSFPAGPRVAHRALAGAGVAILVTGIMWQAMDQIDLVILANAAPRHDVALYGAAGRISLLLAVPLFLVEFVVSPLVGPLNARGEMHSLQLLLRRSATIAMLPTALGAIAVLAGGRWILAGLYGSYYGQAWPVLAVLAAGDLAFVLTGSCGLVLWMTGHQRVTATVATVFAVTTLGVAIATAHAFGMLGLAVTMGIGIVGQNVVLLVLAKRRLGIWTHVYVRPRAISEAVASVVHAGSTTPVAAISALADVNR
jgi:O-antigen/teichoic acid export membrane protein